MVCSAETIRINVLYAFITTKNHNATNMTVSTYSDFILFNETMALKHAMFYPILKICKLKRNYYHIREHDRDQCQDVKKFQSYKKWVLAKIVCILILHI